jgi:hypothetical protein
MVNISNSLKYFAVSLWLTVAKPEAEVNGKNYR